MSGDSLQLLDLTIHNGDPAAPLVVLVHGFGMNSHFWGDPAACRVLGGLAPMTVFLAQGPEDRQRPGRLSFGRQAPGWQGMGDRLAAGGFGVVSWSQAQPLGPARLATDELVWLLAELRRRYPGRGIFLVGHSRGGVVARLALAEDNPKNIAGLVTISSPHGGTRLAELAPYCQPAGAFLARLLPNRTDGRITQALARLAGFLASPAIDELRPGGGLAAAVAGLGPLAVPALAVGGTDPALCTFYVRLRDGDPWRGYGLHDILSRIIPRDLLPDELATGRGDGLVTAASAHLAGARCHDLPCNHVRTAYDPRVYDLVRGFLAAHA